MPKFVVDGKETEKVVKLRLVQRNGCVKLVVMEDGAESWEILKILNDGTIERARYVTPASGFQVEPEGRVVISGVTVSN